jgi:hypothetical protein
LKTPNEFDYVEKLPDEYWFQFEVNVVLLRLRVVLADKGQVLEEDQDDEADCAYDENRNP